MTSVGMSEMIQNCDIEVEIVTNVYHCQNLFFHFPYCHLNHSASWKSNKVYLSMSCAKQLMFCDVMLTFHAETKYNVYSST